MASMPATTKQINAVDPYRMPMRLWSTVVIQLQKPVSTRGRGIALRLGCGAGLTRMAARASSSAYGNSAQITSQT